MTGSPHPWAAASFPFQIVQDTTKILMLFEFADAVRTIHLDEVAPYPNVASMGYSVGRWDGDTLVVTTSNFTDHTWFDRSGNFHSDALKVEERFTRMSADAILSEVTLEGPKVFTRPWKISMPLYRRLDENARLMEFMCRDDGRETGWISSQGTARRAMRGTHDDRRNYSDNRSGRGRV